MFTVNKLILLAALFFSTQAYPENWDFLVIEDNYVLGVRGISKLGDSEFMQLNMLEGFLPKGRDLGYTRTVGSRVRLIIFECNAKNAILLGVWVRDIKHNIIEKTLASSLDTWPPIPRISDAAVDRAINYACGDKTAKIAQPRNATKSPPKDLITLVCHLDYTNEPLVFRVSYSENTVNGLPALIDDTSITFINQTADRAFVTKINRITGRINVQSSKEGISFGGDCKPQSKPKF